MNDYITREAAKKAIQKALVDGTGYGEAINAIPPADVIPREQMSNSVEEALIALDTFFNEGQLDDSAYSALYDLISTILPDEKEET